MKKNIPPVRPTHNARNTVIRHIDALGKVFKDHDCIWDVVALLVSMFEKLAQAHGSLVKDGFVLKQPVGYGHHISKVNTALADYDHFSKAIKCFRKAALKCLRKK